MILKDISISTQKIIAREFLLFLIVLLIPAFSYIYIYLHNSSLQKEYALRDYQMEAKRKLIDSLTMYYNQEFSDNNTKRDSSIPKSLLLFYYLDYNNYTEAKEDYIFFMSLMGDYEKRKIFYNTFSSNYNKNHNVYFTYSKFDSMFCSNIQTDITTFKASHNPYEASVQKMRHESSWLFKERERLSEHFG